MKTQLLSTLKKYKKDYLKQDIFSGIIIAAVSIPISMGYAQIAGLPPAYGLYGSILPILLFAIFSTSKQFIFGVDAAPAALAGSALLSLGIVPGSEAALNYIPILALFTGLWLLFFYIIKADRIVNFISTPVMGGFISGISLTIIFMQIPKLMGSSAGSGEIIELAEHIYAAGQDFHGLSLGLGLGTLLIIRICKKWIPKFPIAILIMAAGVVSTVYFHVDAKGVALLDSVGTGLPPFFVPDFSQVDLAQAVGRGLMISLVVMAETLLAENNFAFRNGYNLNDRQEILACAAGNVASAFVGCCGEWKHFPDIYERTIWRALSSCFHCCRHYYGNSTVIFHRLHWIPADSGSDRNCDIRTYGRCRGSFMYPPLPTKQTGFFHFHGSLYQCIIFRNNLRCAHRCIAFILCRYHKIRESNSFFSWCDSRKRWIL